ncbi:MAG: threonine--tRNA ligase [Solirubrobacterales bacterium]|nr:threonine--tRNA ligase [Solirubrobacterales bacterium]
MEFELPDGTILHLADAATGADAAAAIGPGLARAALAVRIDGELRDLSRPLPAGNDHRPRLEMLTERGGDDALALVRHDAAHVLAAAVLDTYPGVKIAIGPAIENGFYYDFEFPAGTVVNDDDFPLLEAAMARHIAADERFTREDVPVREALARFRAEDQPYKVELIEDLIANQGARTVSLYTNGPFTDLCRGPHAPSTRRIKAFKLQSVAGSYWRGDSSRTMLTRVYGTAFFSAGDLKAFEELLERARANDHRRLGPQLGLFGFSETAPGSAFWYPAGTEVYNALVELSREMGGERGYTEVKTPILYDRSLWETSGHWQKYREHMFTTESEDRAMAVKPMNCPGHCQLYAMRPHSYRDLPVRYAEPGPLHRNEPSGTLHGLLRVRHFTQDDNHVFCTEDQIQDEVARALRYAFDVYDVFGFETSLELSTRPENRIGSEALWDRSEAALRAALDSQSLAYRVNEGDGAFYGPKIDMHVTDALGRSWQLGTCQLDYNFPERFELTYTGADNAEHRPVMLHIALMGSYERFIGILLEHTGGGLPVWLAPVQAIVLTIADRHAVYGGLARDRLREAGLRAELDDRDESVGRKIRDAELRKIPYMLIVGDREAQRDEVSVRAHGEGDLGATPLREFVERLAQAARTRAAR